MKTKYGKDVKIRLIEILRSNVANTEIFNKMASKYETDSRIDFAKLVVKELMGSIVNCQDKVFLDFGCATGLISELVATEFKEVILLDSASEMLAIAKNKFINKKYSNYQVICLDLEQNQELEIEVDVILISQVLLHIPNYLELITKLRKNLKDEGKLIIVDFVKNEAVKSDLVHNGFNLITLENELKENGFHQIKSKIIHEDEKMFMNNNCQVFLMEGIKKG